MPVHTEIWPSHYQDSVVLMRIATALRDCADVREAAVLMGTPTNHGLLERAGLASRESAAAGPEDLVIAVDASSESRAIAALELAREMLTARREVGSDEADPAPRSLETAHRLLPDANLVAISVPGQFAKREALRALRRGLHVFLFSDNVGLDEEVTLKDAALERGLLCMGPDCGTAYLNGTGLGFYNVVPRGRVGCVAASGTGLQALACGLAALGEGISQAVGVGGRDLSATVAGRMTLFSLDALAADPGTAAIVVVSKPPSDEVMPALEAKLADIDKPTIVCCLGAAGATSGGAQWVSTLDDAAAAAVMRLRGEAWRPAPFRHPEHTRARLERVRRRANPEGLELLGLFTGGTLAHEARLVLAPLIGPVAEDLTPSSSEICHRILDVGDDAYTLGRPHPMLDPETRLEVLRGAERTAIPGVLLLDLVLGRGAHGDPAAPLAEEVARLLTAAAAQARPLVAVASVVGTSDDPQDLAAQTARLETAGVEVFRSSAEAARFAGLLLRPGAAADMLEDTP